MMVEETLASPQRFVFFSAPLDDLTLAETVARVREAIVERRRIQHVVVNVAKLVYMQHDSTLRRDVEESDIVNADGVGIVWGCRLLGLPIRERVAGIDLFIALLELDFPANFSLLFFFVLR